MALLPTHTERDGERRYSINIGSDPEDFVDFVEALAGPLVREAEARPDGLAASILNAYEQIINRIEGTVNDEPGADS